MNRATKAGIIVALPLLCGAAQADIVADSVIDHSGVQGDKGWHYGWFAGEDVLGSMGSLSVDTSTFTQMNYFSATSEIWAINPGSLGDSPGIEAGDTPPTFATVILDSLMHANGPITGGSNAGDIQWASRRWVSNFAGDITLSGLIAKFDQLGGPAGDGTDAAILFNGVEIFSYGVDNDDFEGTEFSMDLVVEAGDTIDLILGARGDALFDATTFTAQIEGTPVPAPGAISLIGIGGLLTTRRRR